MRLTIYHRDQIRRALLESRFKKTHEDLKEQECLIALELYQEAFSDAEIRKMKRLPVGWLPKTSGIKVQVNSVMRFYSLKKEQFITHAKYHPYNHKCLLNLEAKSKLAIKIEKLESAKGDIKSERDQLNNEIRGVLNSFNTVKQAKERWPEISKEITKVCGDDMKTTTALAPRLDNLNKKLGLVCLLKGS